MANAQNGHLNAEREMRFTSDAGLVVGVYSGGTIAVGHVLAKRINESELEMLYHGATNEGVHTAGKAHATCSPDDTGCLRMQLAWQWLTGDRSRGHSEWILIDNAT